LGKDRIELGNRKTVSADVYVAKISYQDRHFNFAHIATFEGTAEAIGAQTLEGLGVWLDPRNTKIIATRKKNVMFYH
jgi:predicted aspartyl protease